MLQNHLTDYYYYPLGTVRPVYRDRRFATLQRTLFYIFNQQIYFII